MRGVLMCALSFAPQAATKQIAKRVSPEEKDGDHRKTDHAYGQGGQEGFAGTGPGFYD
jgi:hypothetical protein